MMMYDDCDNGMITMIILVKIIKRKINGDDDDDDKD